MNKKYYAASFVLMFIFCLSVLSFLCDGAMTSEEYFAKAEAKYANNDLEGAIVDLELALRSDPENSDAIYLAGLCVNLLAFQYFSEKEYDKALPYLERLHELSPDDKEIAGMYYISRNKAKKPALDQTEQEKKKTSQMRQENGLKQAYSITPGSMFLIIVLMVLTVILAGLYYNRRSDAMYIKYQEKILSKISKPGMPGGSGLREREAAKKLTAADPQARIHAIEAIETELAGKGKEKEIGIRLLQPFIEDNDRDVKLRATKALYKYDSADALDKFTILGHSADSGTCIKTVKALAEIPSEKTVRILFGIGVNNDKKVVREVIKILYEVYEKGTEEFSEDTKKLIEDFISASQKEWIVE